MNGIVEHVTYHRYKTKSMDLFCRKCGHLIKQNYRLKDPIELKCGQCGRKNTFFQNKNVRQFGTRRYHMKYPINYWN